MKIRINISLFTCGTCKQEYNNKLAHTCVVSWQDLGKAASMRKKTKR